jgi:hypothetical protein
MTDGRPYTEGEYRVGINFNPSGDEQVDYVKKSTADLIDHVAHISADRNHPGARCASLAMTAYEEAAMWAVKAITKQPR